MNYGFLWWRQAMASTALMAEAQSVIALRLLGMAGLWPVPRGENERMVSEKGPAFLEGWMAAQRALWTGQDTESVLNAWRRPITRTARANRKRLSRRR